MYQYVNDQVLAVELTFNEGGQLEKAIGYRNGAGGVEGIELNPTDLAKSKAAGAGNIILKMTSPKV